MDAMDQSHAVSVQKTEEGRISFRAKEALEAWNKLSKADKIHLAKLFREIIVLYAKSGKVIPLDVEFMSKYAELLEKSAKYYESELSKCKSELESAKKKLSVFESEESEWDEQRKMLEATIDRLRQENEKLQRLLNMYRESSENLSQIRMFLCINLSSGALEKLEGFRSVEQTVKKLCKA